jgi:hypothetical protein
MRQLVIDIITDATSFGFDLSQLEANPPTTVADLPSLTDEQLLDIYTEAVGFAG